MVEKPERFALRHISVLLLAVLFIAAVALRVHYFEPTIQRTPDERTYARQANIVLQHGSSGFHFLGDELASNLPAVSQYPSPMRVGYITLVMMMMHLANDTSVLPGACLSFACSLGALLLIAITAYRYLSARTAVIATLFYAVSPLDLMIFRRSWEESLIVLITVASLALASFLARANGKRQLYGFAAFTFVGYLAMTTKENSTLTFHLSAFGLMLYFLLQRDRRAALLTAACSVAAVVAYLITLASLFGGLSRSIQLARGYAHYSGINPYSVQFDSGPPWLLPLALFRVSPFLAIGCGIGCFVALRAAFRESGFRNAGLPMGLALLVLVTFAIQLVTERYSLRYSAPVYGAMYLLAGVGADAVLRALRKVLAPIGSVAATSCLAFAVCILAYRDLNFAQEKILWPQTQDLVLRPLLELPPAPVPPSFPR